MRATLILRRWAHWTGLIVRVGLVNEACNRPGGPPATGAPAPNDRRARRVHAARMRRASRLEFQTQRASLNKKR